MDLVDWSEAKFRQIEHDFRTLMWRFGFREAVAIPVAAVSGDNVASHSRMMPWYNGPSLLQHLEEIPSRGTEPTGAFRMPVQTVLRDTRADFRGLAGTISSGTVRVGDTVVDPVSRRTAKVQRIATMNRDFEEAIQGQAVAIQLDTDLDVSRGSVLAAPEAAPVVARTLEARFVWLSETPFEKKGSYLVRTATDLVPVTGIEIKSLLDLDSLAVHPASTCKVNDIAIAHVALGRATAIDRFSEAPETGAFMLVDAITGATIAGGIVTAASPDIQQQDNVFMLTRALLARGLCSDLPNTQEAEAEFRRRANEVALLLRSAGVAVEIESLPDYVI
jgi:bifunctional enzyme CysN/CysC